MRERKGRAGEREALGRGREAQTKRAQEAGSRAARAPRLGATLPGPLGLRVSPMRSLPVTARGRGKSARAERTVTQLCTPKGRCPAPGAQSFSAPAPLPALNGSVIDWPRVLFSPRAAGARGWLISIFPAASPRSRSSCSGPPRRPRIYLRFNKKWELSQGLGLVR